MATQRFSDRRRCHDLLPCQREGGGKEEEEKEGTWVLTLSRDKVRSVGGSGDGRLGGGNGGSNGGVDGDT